MSRSSSCHAPPWNVFLTTVSPSSLRGLKCRAMSASSSSPHLRLMAKRVSSGSTRPRTMICDPGFNPPGTCTMSLAFCKRQTGKQNTYTTSLAFKRQTGKLVNRTHTPCRWLSASVRQVNRTRTPRRWFLQASGRSTEHVHHVVGFLQASDR